MCGRCKPREFVLEQEKIVKVEKEKKTSKKDEKKKEKKDQLLKAQLKPEAAYKKIDREDKGFIVCDHEKTVENKDEKAIEKKLEPKKQKKEVPKKKISS